MTALPPVMRDTMSHPIAPPTPADDAPPALDVPALEVIGVTRSFDRAPALIDVSLTLGRAEILCLVGPSGCGKSSLLRVVSGVDGAARGTVRMDGVDIAGPGLFVEPEQRRIGFMFQDYALFPHLTVAGNIGFGLKSMSSAQARQRVADTMDRIGIAALAGRFPHNLSGGEQQRVALARALAPRPDVLLMDEPFSNLDRGLRERLRDETVAHLRALGTAAIIVTHDPDEALSCGDRLAVMQGGRIVQQGTARDLYARPATPFVAQFLGPCAGFPGICRGGVIETPLGPVPAPGCLDGGPANVLVRPEHIVVDPQGAAATVTRVTFLGSTEAVTVQVAGVPAPLVLRTAPGVARVGDTVGVGLNADHAMVFPTDEEG